MGWFLFFCFDTRMHGGSTPPATPQMQLQLREGRKQGVQEVKGLAPHGGGWPSGARPTQPSQTVQVAGAHFNRRGAETQREENAFGISLRLCVSAVIFGRECEWGCFGE